MRRWLAIFLLLLASATPAAAEVVEVAKRRIYGFSTNGEYFAFAEYGVQAGSGAPFANIYIIAVERDAWVPGTPVRVHFGERPGPAGLALQEAEKLAAELFKKYDIAAAGKVVASNAARELVADARRLAFRPPRRARPHSGGQEVFELAEIDFPDSERCRQWGIDEKGFALYFRRGLAAGEVHRDRRVPASRLCPARYELSDVVFHEPPGAARAPRDRGARYMVLVRYFRKGFEGLEGRYLAVSPRMDKVRQP